MLRLFGYPQLDGPAAGPKLPGAAYIAVARLDSSPGRRIPRSELATWLYPGATGPGAYANLRQMLKSCRAFEASAGVAVFAADTETVGRPPETVPSDLSILLSLKTVATSEALDRLAGLWRGDLLEGFDDVEGEAAVWLIAEREEVRERFVSLAIEGALAVRSRQAADLLSQIVEFAPFDEDLARAQMVVATTLGSDPSRPYERLSRRLYDDLSARPTGRTDRLLRELAPATPTAGTAPDLPAMLTGVPRLLVLPPLSAHLESGARALTLGEALIDEVIHSLSQARTFAVCASHTARRLAAAPFDRGNPYRADYLVSTALKPGHGNQTRLSVTLSAIATHEIILSEEMQFREETLEASHFSLASGLGARVAQGIEQRELTISRATGAASSYVHYLIGNEQMRAAELPNLRRARKRFAHALTLSPRFSRARAMLARTLSLEYLLLGRQDRAPLDAALIQARQAHAEDPGDPLVHREVGHALIYLDRLDEAVESLSMAADRGPHYADVLCMLADALIHIGKHPDARPLLDRALDLNPLGPDVYHWTDATSHFLLRDYEACKQSIARMQNPASAGRISAAAEALAGNVEMARRHRDAFMAEHPDFSLANYLFPIRNATDRDHLLTGLRVAGFA